MENKIIENNKNGDNDFFEITCNEEEMAKKYQKFYDYLVTDENGIRHDLDKLKKNYDKNTSLLTCSIFAVNFWRKKEKNKININGIDDNDNDNDKIKMDDKEDGKANEIKHMMETLNYNIRSYKPKPELNEYDCNIQKQIDMVNSIEKIFGAFMSIDLKLFDIKKFDDFMNMKKENYAEFYNAIWVAKRLSNLKLINQYKIFLNNNKVLDTKTAQDGKRCSLWKINLALNGDDLKKVETRIQEISIWESYICALDSFFEKENYEFNRDSYKGIGVSSLKDVLKFNSDQLKKTKNKDNERWPLINGCLWVAEMKDNMDKISKTIDNLKNHPEQEIKNNLEEKILWNNKCTSEKRKDFFKIANSVDEMRKQYKQHTDFVMKNSIFADLQKPIDDVVKRFSEVNQDLQLKDKKDKTDEKEVTVESKLRDKYKDVHIATFAVNHFNKNNSQINDNQKINESIAIMHTLEIDTSAPVTDLNKEACIIEKIFLAFMDVDISKFNINKFDSFVKMESETYMKFIEIVTAAAHAYKFIEKYQEFLDKNEKIDRDIEELRGLKLPCDFYTTEDDIVKEISSRENSKIKLALSKSDFENVKKRIDQLSSFAEYFYALQNMFDDATINAYYNRLAEKGNGDAKKYLNSNDTQKNDQLNSSLTKLWDQSLDSLISTYHSNLSDKALLKNFSYGLACVKKNIPNMLFNPEKSQTTKEIVEKLKQKINAQENFNAEKSYEENIKLIKDAYQKIADDVFNEEYKDWGYVKCNDNFINQGKQEAKEHINSTTKMIAGEYMEAKAKDIAQKIKYTKEQIQRLRDKNEPTTSLGGDLAKLETKLERIKKFNESKGQDGKGHVPTIIVEDKYFDNEYIKSINENLYESESMSNWDHNRNFLTKQTQDTCYFMSILIGLIEQGMGSYIQKYIIRDYDPDNKGKTDKAVVRLFDENGCPVDFVVDKSKPSSGERPLWIYVLEKAVSVMMNKTNFKSQVSVERLGHRYRNGASITKDVDWNELEKKQKNKEDIFEEKAFRTKDIANATESTGIQMILGKTFFKKCTGKQGRKIEYAKEGDETLGFIEEALQNNKLVLASTYHKCLNMDCKSCDKGIPHGDFIRFDQNLKFPQYHVGYIKSIDRKNKRIQLIESLHGMTEITFSQFKKHFSDIHVTDFPKEAERLKEKEQSEKLQNEVKKNSGILKNAKDSIQNFEKTRVKIKEDIENGINKLTSKIEENKQNIETKTNNSIKSINDKIEQFTTKMNELKNDIQQNSGKLSILNNSLKQINDEIQNIKTNTGKFDTEIKTQIDRIPDRQKQIKDSYKEIVDDVQQQNKLINENTEDISNNLQNMNDSIQQQDYDQLLNDKTTLDYIKQRIHELQNSKIPLAKNIESKANQLNDNIQRFTTTCTNYIKSIKQQKTNLQDSIRQKNSNLTQLTGENSDFKKLDNFITTKQQYKNALAQQAEKIKEDIDNIKAQNQNLKETTDKNLNEINTERNKVKNQWELYCNQINEWNKIPSTIDLAQKNLEQLKKNPDTTEELKKEINQNLLELNNIKKDFNSQIKEQINKEDETQNQQMQDLLQIERQINQLGSLLQDFEDQMDECTKTLNNEQDKFKTIDEQIETLENNKKDFEESMKENTQTLNTEKNNLDKIGGQIQSLENNKKDFEDQINRHTKTLNDEQDKLKAIDDQINQLNQRCKQLENEIQRKIAEKYDLTSNKIKKWGIGVSVIGGVGTISVVVIPGIKIVFIAVPSPFALLGIVLLGIYFYRNNKKPPRETTIITEPVVNVDQNPVREVIDEDKNVNDQPEQDDNNENIITTKSDI